MGQPARTRRNRAFTLIELLVVIAILAILVAILLPAIAESRNVARKLICESDERQYGIASSNYATDFKDLVFSFTWRRGVDYGFGGAAFDDNEAAANQAIYILRTRADRTDLQPIPGWTPHVLYSHLVLNDYLQQRLPEKSMACPEGRQRLRWQESVYPDWNGYFRLVPNIERPPGSGNNEKRWPYSSSYTLVPAGYSPDQRFGSTNTVTQGPTHNTYFMGTPNLTRLGDRKFSDVKFPQQKILVYERYARHQGKRAYFYAYASAKNPILCFDGSVTTRRTIDTNRGFAPNNPQNHTAVTMVNFQPAGWEPSTLNGAASQTLPGHYQWTRGGLSGVDFGGTEVKGRRP